MRDSGRSGNSPLRQRLRNALVVAEVSLAVVLLVGAALFIGSFVALMRIDPGFDHDQCAHGADYATCRVGVGAG